MTDTLSQEPPAPLGRVVATERRPNTPHEFHFWTALESPVGIGTIVRVDGRPTNGQIPHIYGVVVEGFSYTDLQSPLHDVIGHDASPESAVGGGLSWLQSGDTIRIDLNTGRCDALVSPEEIARRQRDLPAPPVPASQSPWEALYREKTGQLADGATLDFALAFQRISEKTPRHNH